MGFITPLVVILLIAMAVLIGYLQSAQWLVLVLGALFAAAYINGKWKMWRKMCSRRDLKFYQSVLAIYFVETALVFALYWIGRGLSTQFFKLPQGM